MESSMEECHGKLTTSSKKKLKEKTNSGSSLKGSMSNSLFSSSNSNTSSNVGRMDTSDLPSFQNDRTLSSSSSEGKLSNFVTGLKNHTTTPEVNSTSTKPTKKKSGSESSGSGASISGGQGSMTNSTHSEGGTRRGLAHANRGFSSGSSDAEDEKDKEQKHRLSHRTKPVKPTKPSPLESDDEATDSADEGNSEGEERGRRRRGEIPGGILGLRQSNRLMSRKDSSESTNSATSPMNNSTLTTSTIFVESALPKEPMIGPVNMAVGYGAAADSMAPPSVFDKTPSQSPLGTPTMDSPKMVSDGKRSPGTPIPLSPPSVEATERPSSMAAASSTNVTPSVVSLNPVQPSPSLQGSSFNLPFENWVYQAQAVYSPFPLSSSHPGSVATTPVAVESGPYLRTGAPVFLRGTVCQESEGVLIVSVQWRNKTFSGSLIDMNQHEWAPPRLAGGFDEPLTHLKDLCKQQEKRETENQQVNVDVEGDDSTKDTTNGSEKMDCSTKEDETSRDSTAVLESSAVYKNREGKEDTKSQLETSNALSGEQQAQMETNEERRPKLPRNQSIESELGDMEIVEEPTQGQISSASLHKPKLGAAKVSVDSVYSDISDVSDSEEKGRREGSSQPSQTAGHNGVSQVTPPFVTSEPPSSHTQAPHGSRPKKIPAEEIQHTLPPFSAINASSSQDVQYDRRLKPKAGEDKDSSDSSASILRSNLLSSYPSTSTSGGVTVSTPNQNHRHSFASNTSGSQGAVTGSALGNTAVIHGQTMTSSEHPKSHSELASKPATKSSNFSIEALNARSGSEGKVHSRSSSPHPLSLRPIENRGRSTSPMRKTKREPPNLPPFNVTGVVHQEMSKTTLDYMPPRPGHRPQGTADDSDSSGSGSILSTHRKKKSAKQHRKGAEPLTGLKDGKEEVSSNAPETPALGPIGIHNFNLKIQPISPGIDYSAQQQHMPTSISKDGPTAPVSVSNASSLSSPARSPAARVASPHAATVGEVMGLLATGSGGTFKEGGVANLVSAPKPLREAEKGEKESHAKEPPLSERRHAGSSSSPSSISSTSITGVSLGMPAPGYPLPRGVIQATSQAIKQEQFKMRSPVPPEMLRQDREQNQPPRKRKNSPTTATGDPSRHSSSGAEHEEGVNPDSALRGQHPAHAFQQQGFPPYLPEGEKMDGLPADFSYDPNLPMNIHYQFLSYVNQKKQAQAKEYEDQLKEINRKDREEIERQASHISLRQQQQQQQQQQNPRPAKRARIGEHHMTPSVPPLQMPHNSPPATSKDHSGKQKKPSGHHQHRMTGAHMDHTDERHYPGSSHGQPHPVSIKSEPFDISRHSSHKQQSGGIMKQPQLHPGQRSQPMPNASSKPSSQKQNQPQSRVKTEQPFIKVEAGSEQQQHHVPPPGAVPSWPVIPVHYQYPIFQQHQQQQQAHALQGKEAKPKDHKEHKEGSQHTAYHTQPISAPFVALSPGSQGWPTTAPFIHAHSNIVQAGVSAAERSSRQEHSNSPVTTTTSVITGKGTTSDVHSPSHHRGHRSMGQSSPSSTGKKSSNFATDSGSDRRSGAHKMHSSHEHGRPPSSNSLPTNRRIEGSSPNQRSGPYPNQADGESSRRSNSHPHSHSHSTASSSASSSSSTTQQSGSHPSSSRSHKSSDYLVSTQLQAQAAVHQMNAALQQQQQSLSSPLPGIQLRQGIPTCIAPSLVPANWEEWARLQEIIQKGQVGIGSADLWQQQMQQMMLAHGVVPIDHATLQALQQQQQQQQQQHQSVEQAANTLQNLQFLQAAATGGIQLMHPAMAGAHPAMAGLYDPAAFGNTMLPFPMAATAQKRES